MQKEVSEPFSREFVRDEHVYRNDAFGEFLLDAVRFFNGTPVLPLPPENVFTGAGVYAIYCIAKNGLYQRFGNEINRTAYNVPIYVGKAVPHGARQGRAVLGEDSNEKPLLERLRQHSRSIASSKTLKPAEFVCRFVIFEGAVANIVPAVEAALIDRHKPLWNSVIDGFGNHDPGKGRAAGKISQWDVLHPGRSWVKNLVGEKPDLKEIMRRVKAYMVGVR